jgi:Ankyrin repeats (many copies)/Ankyrin repeats (3 copies)
MFLKQFILMTAFFFLQISCIQELSLTSLFKLNEFPDEAIVQVAMHFEVPMIAQFKFVCTRYNRLCSIDTIIKNSSFTTQELVDKYKACDEALKHYTQEKNRPLFEHIWNHQRDEDKQKREKLVMHLCGMKTGVTLKNRMRVYRGNHASVAENDQWLRVVAEGKLCKSAASGDKEAVRFLLAQNVDPNCINYKKMSPLHYAANSGNVAVMKLLCGGGADINAQQNKRKRVPLHYASSKGHEGAVKYLLASGAAINVQNKKEYTPLYYACKHNRLSIAKLLLENGAIKDSNLRCVAHHKGYTAMVELFDEYGVPPCIDEQITDLCKVITGNTVVRKMFIGGMGVLVFVNAYLNIALTTQYNVNNHISF